MSATKLRAARSGMDTARGTVRVIDYSSSEAPFASSAPCSSASRAAWASLHRRALVGDLLLVVADLHLGAPAAAPSARASCRRA